MSQKFNREDYFSQLGEIVVVSGKHEKWQKEREKYIYNNEIKTNHKLRSVGDNEIIIEFDNTQLGVVNPEKAKIQAKYWSEQVKTFLKDKFNVTFHQTDHGGISPHLRFIANGLDILPYDIRREYKDRLVNFILKKVEFESKLVKIDQSLIRSKAKLVSIEGQPHFKPKYNDAVEEIIFYYESQLHKPKQSVINTIIESKKVDKQEYKQIELDDVNVSKLKEWWVQCYIEGSRNDVVMALFGMCRKTGLSYDQAENLIKELHNATETYDDWEDESQEIKLNSNYECKPDQVAVYDFLKRQFKEEILAEVSQKLYSCFRKQNNDLLNASQIMAMNIPPIQWIIPYMIEENGYHFIVGRPGQFKTFLTLFMAKSFITGKNFLDKEIKRKYRVLYVDEESRIQRIKNRLEKVFYDVSEEDKQLLSFSISKGSKFTHERINQLETDIQNSNPDVVFMDSWSRFFTGQENSSDDVKLVFNNFVKPIMDKYKCTIIIIHHFNKNNEAKKGNEIRGSSELLAQMDGYLALYKQKDDQYEIYIGKSRDSKEAPALKFRTIDYDDGKLDISLMGEVQIDNRTSDEKNEDKVYNFLMDEGLGGEPFQLSLVTPRLQKQGMGERSAREAIYRLVKKEVLELAGRGYYKFVERETNEENEDLEFEQVK